MTAPKITVNSNAKAKATCQWDQWTPMDPSRRANVNANNNNNNNNGTGCQKDPSIRLRLDQILLPHCRNTSMWLLLSLSPSLSLPQFFLLLTLCAFRFLPAPNGTCCHQSATTICHLPLNFHRQQLEPIPAACSPFAYLFVASCRNALKYPAKRGQLPKLHEQNYET